MTVIDQTQLAGKKRDKPISKELEIVLLKAGKAAGIDTIYVTSGGQPGTKGLSTGSTRHNGGRAADLYLTVGGKIIRFTDKSAPTPITKFVTVAAAQGAIGIGAGVGYMGDATLHVGFGRTLYDSEKVVWGAGGHGVNAPTWLRDAANTGWHNPPDWAHNIDINVPEDLHEDEDEDFLDDGANELPVLNAASDRFPAEVIRAAQSSQRHWNIPASIVLAQWAIESGYGKHMPPNSNNPFGVKAVGNQPHVYAWTTEYVAGKPVKKKEPFRIFESLDDAFIEHGRLLGTSKYYAEARKYVDQPDRFADALTGIYATDPNYGSLLKSIMRRNDIYQFDTTSSQPDTKPSGEHAYYQVLKKGDVDLVRVKALQERLVQLNYKLGKIDGKFGSMTAAALFAFQTDNDLPATGILDYQSEAALMHATPRPLDPEREMADEKYLAEKGSTEVQSARRNRDVSLLTAILGAFGIANSAVENTFPNPTAVLDKLTVGAVLTKEQLDAINNLKLGENYLLSGIAKALPDGTAVSSTAHTIAELGASLVPGFGGSVAILAAGLIGRLLSNRISASRVEAHRTGAEISPLDTRGN